MEPDEKPPADESCEDARAGGDLKALYRLLRYGEADDAEKPGESPSPAATSKWAKPATIVAAVLLGPGLVLVLWCCLAIGSRREVRAVTAALAAGEITCEEALRKLGGPKSAVPLLVRALGDRDAGRRAAAAKALGEAGADAKDAVPALRRLLEDESPQVREAAAEALAKIQPAPARP